MVCQQCQASLPEGFSSCTACGAAVERKAEIDPLLGRTLLNQYVIKEKLGAGGFGAVYLAEQPSMGRKVAIKTLHKHLTHNKNIAARFRREGLAASRLEHPYAVKMHNLGETEDGTLWMAMEFLSGETVEAKLKREGPLSPDALIQLLEPICEVLEEAHRKGIIHRDLKPENLMIVPGHDGRPIPKVLDFGIAALLDDEEFRTQTGVISGTPKYMSPEQWKGLKHTDARSDIYSLGVIAYQCLSGRLPFHADSVPGWMQQHCLEPPLHLEPSANISAAFGSVIMRSLSKDPSSRPQSAKEFIALLKQARESSAVAPTEETRAPVRPPLEVTQPSLTPLLEPQKATKIEVAPVAPSTSSGLRVALGLGGVGVLALLLVVLWPSSEPSTPPTTQPQQTTTSPSSKGSNTTITSLPASASTSAASNVQEASKPAVSQPATLTTSAPASQPLKRFMADLDGEGTITDTKLGLVWTAKDNGRDIGWPKSQSLCAKQGMRLPTVKELMSLYQAGRSVAPRCNKEMKIKSPPGFSLSCFYYWSSQRDGRRGTSVDFSEGDTEVFDYEFDSLYRVLCVRDK